MTKSAFVLSCILVLSGLFTSKAEQPFQLLMCPSAGDYAPDKATRAANLLIRLGEEKAYELLLAEAKKDYLHWADQAQRMAILCTLLWRNEENRPLRRMKLGAAIGLPSRSMGQTDWPLLPLSFSDGVPFLLEFGHILAGQPEPAILYLTYCRENGIFRQVPYEIPAAKKAEQAMERLFASEQWQKLKWKDAWEGGFYELNEEWIKEHLREQIKRMNLSRQ